MTTKTQILSVITAVTLIAGLTSFENAFAHSDTNNSGFYTSGTQSVCYATYGLGLLQFDGSTGNGNGVKTQIKKGMSELSDNTKMYVYETSSCSGYKNWVSAYYDSSPSKMAKTSYKYTTSGTEWRTMDYNSNAYLYWVTNGNCSTNTADLSNVANHEFGHFAGSGHQSGGSSHTMMSSSCDSGFSSIKSADKTYIDGKY